MAGPDWRQTGDDYQQSARFAQHLVGGMLRRLIVMEHARSGRSDAGPFVSGIVGAVIEVVAETDMPFDELREKILQVFDAVAPQVEIERAARRSRAVQPAAGAQ